MNLVFEVKNANGKVIAGFRLKTVIAKNIVSGVDKLRGCPNEDLRYNFNAEYDGSGIVIWGQKQESKFCIENKKLIWLKKKFYREFNIGDEVINHSNSLFIQTGKIKSISNSKIVIGDIKMDLHKFISMNYNLDLQEVEESNFYAKCTLQ